MLGLLLLQVLASCLWLGHSEVVTPFAGCPQFFYAGIPPNDALNPKNPAWICQRFRNSYHYAALYDRDRRIPVYSAYKYQPGDAKRPHSWWFVEPQLIDENLNLKEMETESFLIKQYKITLQDIKKSQAVLDDYRGLKDLVHGHLTPTGHMDDSVSKMATFTLTNIVPQDKSLNDGEWRVYEHKTMIKKTKGCTATYVITGAVPGNTYVSEGRVNRPSHIWSAACCLVDEVPKDAWGAIAENDKNKVEELSLGELEKRLTDLYGGTVTLFNNACPRK
ncbi:endonuclease domain-containing 1 protein-like [Pyrgilauda ruficollis]|uniref:endonuclease domain-containing 1 protein-like n=1 Tax=Pyrgilauda ruficollis TaxID=221976 RepID=UPI001B883233|nr:endonuclease domain-containing 1 protein-like [Pyrgilauda ruficollis]